MDTNKTPLTDLTLAQLEELVESIGEPRYRARQLFTWIHKKLAFSFDEMTDLPASFRRNLAEKASLSTLTPLQQLVGGDGTTKELFSLSDGKTVESTLMPYPAQEGQARFTVCVSTQVGCPIGCAFCATGQQGFERNLTPGEIIDQVRYFARIIKERNRESIITNVVFMGMGEPLANYDALWQAIEVLNAPEGFGLGARSMTISTSGLVPAIERLSKEKLQVGLAISLHAAENELRDKLVPINKTFPLERLMPAVADYFSRTGRRPTFEYILFAGVNDSPEHARALAKLLSGLTCHVNLIPANPTKDSTLQPPTREQVNAFERELKAQGVTCTLRAKKGVDIAAGCGQLRSRFLKRK